MALLRKRLWQRKGKGCRAAPVRRSLTRFDEQAVYLMATGQSFSECWQSERKDQLLINNRQAGRRNRGRNNNGRPNGGNRGGGDSGNRIDNRARGNAAQLLEKYKNMARDAQMAGDRVNAEYYLQFADHYFRVLADNRARQEEQQQRFRRPDENFEDDGDDFYAPDYGAEDGRGDQPQFERAAEGERRRDDQREGREARNRRDRDRNRRDRSSFGETTEQPQQDSVARPEPVDAAPEPQPQAPAEAAEQAPRPRRGRPRKADAAPSEGAESLDLTVLPPSIARADNDSESEGEAEPTPRKRTRRPRPAAEAAE